MVDGFILKLLEGLFYLSVAVCVFYGLWGLFRSYRRINSTVIKTYSTAYELRKMIENRSR